MIMLKRVFSLSMLILLLYACGCSRTREPIYIDEIFKTNPPVSMNVLPVVDARKDKSNIKVKDKLSETQDYIVSELKRVRHFEADKLDQFAVTPCPSDDEIAQMNEKDLMKLAPRNGKPSFLYMIEDVSVSYAIIAKSCKGEGRAYIIEPETGKIVWKDACAKSAGQGGLVSGFFPMTNMALWVPIDEILLSLPDAKKK